MSRFKQIFGVSDEVKGVQDNAREKFQSLDTVPFLQGVWLRNLPLSRTPRDVPHKLERDYQGFIVTKQPQGSEAEPWQNWTPGISGSGGLTWTTPVVLFATYSRSGNMLRVAFRLSGTLGGVAASSVFVTGLPFAGFDNAGVGVGQIQPVGSVWFIAGVQDLGFCGFTRTTGFTSLEIFRRDQSNYPTAGSLSVTGNLIYRINDSDAYYGPSVSVVESPQDTKSAIIRLQADVAGNYDIWVF